MDPLALSYPLTNINIHVQYGSNLIMCTMYDYSFWRNPGELFVVFRGTKVSAKSSAQETHAQLRTSLSSVKRELSSMGGGGGLLWSEWANLAFRLYFKTSSQNRHMVFSDTELISQSDMWVTVKYQCISLQLIWCYDACGRWQIIAIFLYPIKCQFTDINIISWLFSKISFNVMYTFT